MNRRELQELLHSGFGRAHVYARENDVSEFRDTLLDACLHCHGVDPQCEGTRAAYMFDLVDLLPDRQFYCDEVLKALPGSADDWDAAQRFHFAKHMSLDGDERAKQVMYESFEPGPRKGVNIALNFVQMDGLKGLLFAVGKVGALLMSKQDVDDVSWLWSHAAEVCGEREVTAALSAAGATNPSGRGLSPGGCGG